MSLLKKTLLKVARKVVEHVMSQLMQQLRIVTDQAINPMQIMVQQVTGGIWRGKGSDEFVRVVTNMMMPDARKVTDHITTVNKNIRFAIDRIDQADVKANTAFQQLGDTFSKIF